MKKVIALILALVMGMVLCGCGNGAPSENADSNSVETVVNAPTGDTSLPKNIQMYTPGVTVETNFGEITVLDAAFCGKAQLIDALPRPAYNSAGDGRIIFAMRTLISNTTGTELVLMDDLKVSVQYGKEDSFGCSKGGNYKSSDPLYKRLPAGTSGEYIICGRIPVETYRSGDLFCVSFHGVQLGFARENVQVYNCMGYQEGDNLLTSIENVIALAGTAPAETKQESDGDTQAVPELAFALEDMRYENTGAHSTVEAKIRNNSNTALVSLVFDGVILDANGDILENCTAYYRNGLEAGQAGWASIRIIEPTTLAAMDSIKIITLWYKDDPQSPSHNLRFDLPEPLVIALADVMG